VIKLLSDRNFAGTVFAPTNAAFARLLRDLHVTKRQLLRNKALLTEVGWGGGAGPAADDPLQASCCHGGCSCSSAGSTNPANISVHRVPSERAPLRAPLHRWRYGLQVLLYHVFPSAPIFSKDLTIRQWIQTLVAGPKGVLKLIKVFKRGEGTVVRAFTTSGGTSKVGGGRRGGCMAGRVILLTKRGGGEAGRHWRPSKALKLAPAGARCKPAVAAEPAMEHCAAPHLQLCLANSIAGKEQP
jgi:uncharacterized surface protein with fasciclin (FAS1) repeats